jgi:PmbA protein
MNFELLFEKAKAKGIEDIQIFLNSRKEIKVQGFQGELDEYSISDITTLSAKGIYNKQMGSVSTETVNDSNIEFILDSIIESASATTSKDEVFIYEGDSHYEEIKGLFNEELEDLEVSKGIEDLLALEKTALSIDKRVDKVKIYFTKSANSLKIKNSKGLSLEKKKNQVLFAVYAIASEDGDTRTGMDYLITNNYKDFDFETMAKNAIEEATAKLGAKPCKSGSYEILLTNKASSDLLATFSGMFSSDNVQKGMSMLDGKLGEKVASDSINILDDPSVVVSPNAGSFDSEGVATKKKTLIENGVLNTYLYNLKTAKKDGVSSTGNGFGGGVSPTGLYIQSGESNFDTLVSSMKKGIIVSELAGLHSGANPINGDFSLQTTGFLVEDGKIVRPVALITVSGNYLEMLKGTTDICSDIKYNFSGVGSPSLKISSMMISGE